MLHGTQLISGVAWNTTNCLLWPTCAVNGNNCKLFAVALPNGISKLIFLDIDLVYDLVKIWPVRYWVCAAHKGLTLVNLSIWEFDSPLLAIGSRESKIARRRPVSAAPVDDGEMSTRRRDRRNPGGPTPTAPRPAATTAATSRSHHPLFSTPLLPLALFALAAIVLLLIMYRGGKTGLPEATSLALSVYERGLVKPNVAFQEILAVSTSLF